MHGHHPVLDELCYIVASECWHSAYPACCRSCGRGQHPGKRIVPLTSARTRHGCKARNEGAFGMRRTAAVFCGCSCAAASQAHGLPTPSVMGAHDFSRAPLGAWERMGAHGGVLGRYFRDLGRLSARGRYERPGSAGSAGSRLGGSGGVGARARGWVPLQGALASGSARSGEGARSGALAS